MRILRGPAGLLIALAFAVSMWFYVQHVMIGHQISEAQARDIPRGNLSDLYPRWLGARELLLHHRDPYSSEITRDIQAGYYGRPLDPSRPDDPKDQQGFAYPLYVVFLLAPTIKLPFRIVQFGFLGLLGLATLATVLLWIRALKWHPSWWTTAAVIVLTMGSFQVVQGLKLQQLTLLVGAMIALSVVLAAERHLASAGILLAIATIKPQLVSLLAFWLVLWALGDWARRRNLVFAFGGALLLLITGAELLMPGWVGQFRQALGEYRQYNNGALSILQVLLSRLWGTLLAALILLATARLCWKMRQAPTDSPAFVWTTALVLAITILVIPKASPYNQVLLLPGVLLVAQHWRIAWTKSPVARMTLLVSVAILFWPWLAALAIMIIAAFSSLTMLGKAWVAPASTLLAIPFAVCALLGFSLRTLADLREIQS